MVSGITKKIVVIRNFPSNLIEEAILILKSEPGDMDKATGKNTGNIAENREHLLKEAEMIIKNYVKENRLYIENCRRGEKKRIKDWININLFINIMIVGSIALLVLIIMKVI